MKLPGKVRPKRLFTFSVLPNTSNTPQLNTVSNPEPLLAPEVVAKRLDVSLRTLYRITKRRQLRYIKLNGALRFESADVERFIQKRTVNPL